MAKKSKKIIETMDFNNRAHANSVIEESNKKLEKSKPALIISAVATGASLLGMCCSDNSGLYGFLMLIAFVGSIASYILGGGLPIAFRAAKKLAFFGWFVCQFPTDIAVGCITLIFAIWAFFFLPLVFVYINIRQHKKNIKDAEEYIAFCDAEEAKAQAYANAVVMNPAYINAPVYANENPQLFKNANGYPCPPPFKA